MNHSPLQQWADEAPYRWYAVATVICFLVLCAYGYGAVRDELDYMQGLQDEQIAAAQQAQQELNKRIALQEACGGPEATVVDLAHGGYACLDKDGRRTKTIPGRKS